MPIKKRITHGVSFPDEEILEAAKRKAAAMQISFSSYINQLIRKDLGRTGVLDWSHAAPPAKASPRGGKKRLKEAYPLEQRAARAK